MKLTIPDIQNTPVTVTASPAADAAGNPGVFAGPLSYTVSDASIITLRGLGYLLQQRHGI